MLLRLLKNYRLTGPLGQIMEEFQSWVSHFIFFVHNFLEGLVAMAPCSIRLSLQRAFSVQKLVSWKISRFIWVRVHRFSIFLSISLRALYQFQQLIIPMLDLSFGELRQRLLNHLPVLRVLLCQTDHQLIMPRQKLRGLRLGQEVVHVSFSDAPRSTRGHVCFRNHSPVFAHFLNSFDQNRVFFGWKFTWVLKLVSLSVVLFAGERVDLHFYVFPVFTPEEIRSCAFAFTWFQGKRSLVKGTCHWLYCWLSSRSYVNE